MFVMQLAFRPKEEQENVFAHLLKEKKLEKGIVPRKQEAPRIRNFEVQGKGRKHYFSIVPPAQMGLFFDKSGANAIQAANENGAQVALNASLFHSISRPAGLLIINGRMESKFSRSASMYGVLYQKDGAWGIMPSQEFRKKFGVKAGRRLEFPGIENALQSAPLLISQEKGKVKYRGKRTKNANLACPRSAVALLENGEMLLFASTGGTTHRGTVKAVEQFAKEKGLRVNALLNLDGDSSTSYAADGASLVGAKSRVPVFLVAGPAFGAGKKTLATDADDK